MPVLRVYYINGDKYITPIRSEIYWPSGEDVPTARFTFQDQRVAAFGRKRTTDTVATLEEDNGRPSQYIVGLAPNSSTAINEYWFKCYIDKIRRDKNYVYVECLGITNFLNTVSGSFESLMGIDIFGSTVMHLIDRLEAINFFTLESTGIANRKIKFVWPRPGVELDTSFHRFIPTASLKDAVRGIFTAAGFVWNESYDATTGDTTIEAGLIGDWNAAYSGGVPVDLDRVMFETIEESLRSPVNKIIVKSSVPKYERVKFHTLSGSTQSGFVRGNPTATISTLEAHDYWTPGPLKRIIYPPPLAGAVEVEFWEWMRDSAPQYDLTVSELEVFPADVAGNQWKGTPCILVYRCENDDGHIEDRLYFSKLYTGTYNGVNVTHVADDVNYSSESNAPPIWQYQIKYVSESNMHQKHIMVVDEESVHRYGEKSIEIETPRITDVDMAQSILRDYLAQLSTTGDISLLEMRGAPISKVRPNMDVFVTYKPMGIRRTIPVKAIYYDSHSGVKYVMSEKAEHANNALMLRLSALTNYERHAPPEANFALRIEQHSRQWNIGVSSKTTLYTFMGGQWVRNHEAERRRDQSMMG